LPYLLVVETMAPRAFASAITPTTTALSCLIQTDTTLKPSVAVRCSGLVQIAVFLPIATPMHRGASLYATRCRPSRVAVAILRRSISLASKLQLREGANAEARHQHLVLGVGHRIANCLVEQVVAVESDCQVALAERA